MDFVKLADFTYIKYKKGVIFITIESIVELIGQVGFPIVACVLLFVLYFKSFESLKKAVDNNTNVLEKLIEKLGVEK